MKCLLIGGIVIASYIKPNQVDKVLAEMQEDYPNSTITISSHRRMDVVKYYEQMFQEYSLSKEML